jgi:hypothetical protein
MKEIDGWGSHYDGPDDFFYSYTEGKWSDKNKTKDKSKDFLLELMMEKYGITDSDLYDIDKVKVKVRDFKIDEIIK